MPYISNADSLAYNFDTVGAELDSWEALFDSQFRGRAAMQNDFGPTLTNTAIYLKESGKQDIDKPSDMTEKEVAGVAEFLIDLKKKGISARSGTGSRTASTFSRVRKCWCRRAGSRCNSLPRARLRKTSGMAP